MKPGVGMGLSSALALVLGIGLGRWLFHEERGVRSGSSAPAPLATPADSPADSAALLAALRGIERSIEGLARAVELRPPPAPDEAPASRREPSGDAAPADRGELAAALVSLSTAIRELREGKRAVEDSATAQLVTPFRVDRDAVFLATGLRQIALTNNGDALESAERAFRARHLFQTYQEVLSTYGTPDEIEVNERIRTWTYQNRIEGYREHYGFAFDNGTVCDAWYNCDPER